MIGYAVIAKQPRRIVEYNNYHFAIFSTWDEAEKQKTALESWLFGIKILYEDFLSPYRIIKLNFRIKK